jgi:raffinose/stachyose/melibiose transport system substrate-binding protein
VNRRTFLASAAALAIGGGAALAGCGNNNTASTAGGSGGGSGAGPISFLSWDGEATMKPVLDGFKAAHPEIAVTATYSPPVAEYIQTLQTRVLSKKAPDVFLIAAENKTNLIGGKAVENLAGKPFMASVPEFNRKTYGGEGGEFGLSIASWGAGILYNKDLLKKVGAETVPTTWDDFLGLLQKLKAAGVTGYLESLQGMPTILAAFLGAVNAGSNDTMDAKIFDGSAKFVDYWVEPLTQYNRMYAEGLVTTDTVGLKGDQVRDEFAKGKLAMMSTGPWDLPTIRETSPKMDMEMVLVPGASGLPSFLAGAASPGYAISSGSENKAAAETFLTYLASKEGVQAWQKVSGAISVTTDFQPKLDAALDPIVKDVRAGNIYLPQIAWKRSEDILNVEATAQIQQMVQGKVTPTQVAQALDTKLASS